MVVHRNSPGLLAIEPPDRREPPPAPLPAGRLVVRLAHPHDEHPEYFRTSIVGRNGWVLRDLGLWPSVTEAREVATGFTTDEETVLRYLGLLAKILYAFTGDEPVRAEVTQEVTEVLLPALANVEVRFEGELVRVVLDEAGEETLSRRPVAVWRDARLVLDSDLVLRPYAASVSNQAIETALGWSRGGPIPVLLAW